MPICNINAASDTGGTEGNGCKTDGSICDDEEGPGMYGSGGTYTINYYPNGGTVPTSSSCPTSYNAGFSKTINCTPSKTNNEFLGWCTDANLTKSCSTTISITTTTSGDKSFYAKWGSAGGCSDFHGEGCQSEIITDPIGGLVDEYTYEFHCDVQMPGYVTNDFVLCKFDSVSYDNIDSTKCNAGDKCVKQGYSFSWPCIVCEGTPSAITKIYPKWTANKYTVTYACGTGATGTAPNNATATYNATFTPAANTCIKTGYTFAGWNDGSSDRTAGSGFTWNYTENKTFTAKWTAKNITCNAGEYLPANSETCAPCLAGYKCYNKQVTHTYTGEIQGLTWCTAGTYNTGTGNTSCTTCPAGYYCTGGTNKTACSAGTYNALESQTASTACKACATGYESSAGSDKCNAIQYSITYYLNGGTNNANNPKTYTVESSDITLSNPTRSNSTFGGWYTESTFNTKVTTISSGSTGNKSLYAKWTCNNGWTASSDNTECIANTIILSWDTKGIGILPSDTQTSCIYGYSNEISMPVLEATGYNFNGWNVAGHTTNWTSENPVTCRNKENLHTYTGPVTFEANWTPNTYTVTYACGTGATGTAPSEATATYNATFTPTANTCAKTGYTFAGWNDGSSVRTAGTVFTWSYTTDKTFTAQWSPIQSTITLSNEGADVTGTTKLYATYNTGVYINSNRTSSYLMKTDTNEITIPSKTGYKFMGYYSATTGGVQYIAANGYITTDGIDAGKSIATTTANWYAQWELDVVRCDAGYYLPANATECAVCPTGGKYCPGGEYKYNPDDVSGIETCPKSKTYSGSEIKYTTYISSSSGRQVVDGNPWYGASYITDCVLQKKPFDDEQTGNGTQTMRYESSTGDYTGTGLISGTRMYTSCYAGYYMTKKSGDYNGNPAQGNACTICPAGSYCVGGTADKASCPELTTADWKYGLKTGLTQVTECYQYRTPENCTSGNILQYGSSNGGWDSANVKVSQTYPLEAKTNYYVSGTTCTACANGYSNTDPTATSCTPNSYQITMNANGGTLGTAKTVDATYDAALPSLGTTMATALPRRAGYTFAGFYDAETGGTQYYTYAGAAVSNKKYTTARDITLYAHWNECGIGKYCDGSTYNSTKDCPDDYKASTIKGLKSINQCLKLCPSLIIDNCIGTDSMGHAYYPNECNYVYKTPQGTLGIIKNNICVSATSCSNNQEMRNGSCQPCNREHAISYKPIGNCMVAECRSGFVPVGQACLPNKIECAIPNAASSKQVYDERIKAYSECRVEACETGYHELANACVLNNRICTIYNNGAVVGTGNQEWDTLTSSWGECVAERCNPGYTNDPMQSNEPNKQCGECRNKYRVRGEVAVSSYTQECEIASCMYQGELYKLDGNSCVPICEMDGYSDETGSRKWDPVKKKCVRTCNAGYTAW